MARVMGDILLDAAHGVAHPSEPASTLHCVPLRPNFVKVMVDYVVDGFKLLPVPVPVPDEITILQESVGTFIQWPKKDVVLLEQPSSQSASQPCEKNPTPMELVLDLPGVVESVVTPPEDHDVVVITHQEKAIDMPSEQKEKHEKGEKRSRSGKSKSKSKSIKSKGSAKSGMSVSPPSPPPMELARKFVNGEPMVTDQEFASLSTACQRLHQWYMEQSNNILRPVTHTRPQCFKVKFREEHLWHQDLDGVFFVFFEDLFDLIRLDALEQNLLRCWTL